MLMSRTSEHEGPARAGPSMSIASKGSCGASCGVAARLSGRGSCGAQVGGGSLQSSVPAGGCGSLEHRFRMLW